VFFIAIMFLSGGVVGASGEVKKKAV